MGKTTYSCRIGSLEKVCAVLVCARVRARVRRACTSGVYQLACAMFFGRTPAPKHSGGTANAWSHDLPIWRAICLRYTAVGLTAPPWRGREDVGRLGAPSAAAKKMARQARPGKQNNKYQETGLSTDEGFKHQVRPPRAEACSQKPAKNPKLP